MNVSNIELRKQVKLLRNQMAKLEASCKEREDRIVSVLFALEPFVLALTPEQREEAINSINDDD